MDLKKLYRSRSNKVIGGICAGLGKYFNIDPVIIRLGFIFLALAGGPGIVIYLIMCIIVPQEP